VVAAAVALTSFGAVGTAGAKAPAGSVRGINGKAITVATVSFLQLYADAAKGAKARFDRANADKELPGGRTINYLGMVDDKSTADGEVSAIRQEVEQQGVFALVGGLMPYLTSDYVNQQHVPVVGYGVNDAFCTHGSKTPWYVIGLTGCLNAVNPVYGNSSWPGAVLAQLGGVKGKTAACISEDNDGGKNGVKTVCSAATAVGFKVVYEKATIPPAPAVVSDWSPYVQDIMTSNNGQAPDVLFNLPGAASVIGLGTALRQAGYKGINSNPIAGTTPALVGLANGWASYTQWATPESATQENNAAMKQIVADLTAAGVTSVGFPALMGYYSADMFVAITKKVGKNLTPERWAKVASTYNYSIKDTVGPTIFPQGFAAGTPCAQLATSNGTIWEVTQKYGCYESVDNATGKLVPYDKVKVPKA
jgi:ABC-type branched-subunit amino acid transport system substrate-binding protein